VEQTVADHKRCLLDQTTEGECDALAAKIDDLKYPAVKHNIDVDRISAALMLGERSVGG
jgi:hypothetical protein